MYCKVEQSISEEHAVELYLVVGSVDALTSCLHALRLEVSPGFAILHVQFCNIHIVS